MAQAAEARHREVAREHGAPDEVDVLARLAGVREVLVEVDEVRERVVDLGLRERGVAGARHRRVGRDLAHLAQRVGADELALAVEVRADHDGVRLRGEVLERADDALLGGDLLDGGPHEVRQARHLPALDVDSVLQKRLALGLIRGARKVVRNVRGDDLALRRDGPPALLLAVVQLVGEVGCHDVAAQAYGHPLLPVVLEAVDGSVVHLAGLRLARGGEQAGYLLGGIVLLGNNELQSIPRFRVFVLRCDRACARGMRLAVIPERRLAAPIGRSVVAKH